MEKTIVIFGNIEIEKQKFHQHKKQISIQKYIYIKTIVVSNKVSFGKNVFKYFIGYKDAKKFNLYAYLFQKMNAYGRDVDETNYMSFLVKNDELLEKYNDI